MIRKYDVIALLTNVAKSAVKEKVTRVVLATLRVRPTKKPLGVELTFRTYWRSHHPRTYLPCSPPNFLFSLLLSSLGNSPMKRLSKMSST
jgi:hypothetical protein